MDRGERERRKRRGDREERERRGGVTSLLHLSLHGLQVICHLGEEARPLGDSSAHLVWGRRGRRRGSRYGRRRKS